LLTVAALQLIDPAAPTITILQRLRSAVRNRDVNRDHPGARRPSDHRERLWSAVRNRDAPIGDFFPKNKSDLITDCNGLAALGRQGCFLSAAPSLLLGGNSEVSALHKFFAV
jgi:hypothetical protein